MEADTPPAGFPPADNSDYSASNYLQASIANYLIIGSALFAIGYAYYSYWDLSKLVMTKDTLKVSQLSEEKKDEI